MTHFFNKLSRLTNLFFICLMPLGGAVSQQNGSIQTDRPDQTESPFLVPMHFVQVETGLMFESLSPSTYRIQHPNILLKYGVNKNFELRLVAALNTEIEAKEYKHNLNEFALGFKLRICEAKKIRPKTSVIVHYAVPLQRYEALKEYYFIPNFRFTMQHSLHKNINLSYNLGLEWEEKKPIPIYTLSLAYAISEKLGSYIEMYGSFNSGEAPDHRIDGGLTYLITSNIQYDISGGYYLSKINPGYFISTGLSVRRSVRAAP